MAIYVFHKRLVLLLFLFIAAFTGNATIHKNTNIKQVVYSQVINNRTTSFNVTCNQDSAEVCQRTDLSAVSKKLFLSNFRASEPNEIRGIVLYKNGFGIEYATLYNLNRKTSCITNPKGEFKIEGKIGDVLEIRHLNYITKEVEVLFEICEFVLTEKLYKLAEVVVSPKAAFDLFNTACTNTWFTFKEDNLSRAYCRVTRKTNKYIAQTVDLDLDIYQKKYKSFGRGEQVKVFKVQERIEKTGTSIYGIPEMQLTFFYPQIQEIYWVELPNKFNYFKIDEEDFIRLQLINKKDYPYLVRIEVLINRKDSTLHSFAMDKRNLTTFSISSAGIIKRNLAEFDDYLLEKTNHFILYEYKNGFGYLSEYYQDVTIAENKIRENKIELRQHLRTYNNGNEKPERRRGRRRIFENSYNPLKTINRYNTEFWKDYSLMNFTYDFENLMDTKGNIDQKVLVASTDSVDAPDAIEIKKESVNVSRYEMENKTETLLEIAQKFKISTDDILFVPYYIEDDRPVFSEKKYGIQDMLLNIESPEILNNIMQVFYSNKPLVRTNYGCTNFTCTKDLKAWYFLFLM